MSDNERKYTTDDLIKAYIAGVVDASGTFSFQIQQSEGYDVGYQFGAHFRLKKKNPDLVETFANWCDEQEIEARLRRDGDQYFVTIRKLEDLQRFLETLAPFSRAKSVDFRIMLDEIVPRLENDEHTTEDGLIEIMGFVENMPSVSMARRKYTQDYFIQEFKGE